MHFMMDNAALDIKNAVIKVLEEGYRTKDISIKGAKEILTLEMGTLISEAIQ